MATTYHLGVDIGVNRVHAATARRTSSGNERVEPFPLASTVDDMPALMWVSADGEVDFGEDAAARGTEQPETLVDNPRCRIGTEVPFVVAGHRVHAEDAYALLASAVLATVSEAEGGPPDRLVMTHPADWGSHRRTGVRRALEAQCDVPFELLPEPAAAAWGALPAAQPEELWAVYDLGATRLDTALVRRDEDDWILLPATCATAPLGGLDLDDAVVDLLLADTPGSPRQSRSSVGRLRQSSVAAKEALSTGLEAVVTTHPTSGPSTVRLTRGEFEACVQALLEQTVLTLRETIDDGGVSADGISGVVLAGGSSRIPLVSQLLSTALGVPVVADSDPAAVVAMGAARRALRQSELEELAPERATGHRATSEDDLSAHRDDPVVLIPFVRPEQSRVATHAWRLVVASLIVACVAYLAWAFTSDSSGLFGLAPLGHTAVHQPPGRW